MVRRRSGKEKSNIKASSGGWDVAMVGRDEPFACRSANPKVVSF
jgi:hypothetical protein